MSKKSTSLKAAVMGESGVSPTSSNGEVSTAPVTRKSNPSRGGKKHVGAYFSPETTKQLKKLAADRETTLQELMREAINDLFQKNDLPPIA